MKLIQREVIGRRVAVKQQGDIGEQPIRRGIAQARYVAEARYTSGCAEGS